MNKIFGTKKQVKDLQTGLITKIDFNNRVIEIYEVYIGFYIEPITDNLITIYDIEQDKEINVIINEECTVYQYEFLSYTNGLLDLVQEYRENPLSNDVFNYIEGNRN